MPLPFALNHMTVARLRYNEVISLATDLGCVGVEFRNDLPGDLFDGDTPETVSDFAAKAGIRILGLSEVKMFNNWDAGRAKDTEALLKTAKALGAETISLIPRCDGMGCGNGERQANLRVALREILPMLETYNMNALVEPLGFGHSSLRFKADAVDAIVALNGEKRLKLVHDTFHHHLAQETELFPEHTGILHVSGVEDHNLALHQIVDAHRILVGPHDVLGNATQITDLRTGGFDGPISYEAFSPMVHAFGDPKSHLQASMRFIESAVPALHPA